jgi:hypothetical protein
MNLEIQRVNFFIQLPIQGRNVLNEITLLLIIHRIHVALQKGKIAKRSVYKTFTNDPLLSLHMYILYSRLH